LHKYKLMSYVIFAPVEGLSLDQIDFIYRLRGQESVAFHSNSLIQLYGGSYKKRVINPLIDAGIIFDNPSYQVSVYTKEYGLVSTDESKWIPVDTKFSPDNGVHAFSLIRPRIGFPSDIDGILHDYVNSNITPSLVKELDDDYPKDIFYRNKRYGVQDALALCKNDKTFFHFGDSFLYLDRGFDNPTELFRQNTYTAIHKQVTAISSGNLYYKRGIKTRRIFNEISNLPKKIRRQLRIDGEELVEIDMKNAQFALLMYALDNRAMWPLREVNSSKAKKSYADVGWLLDINPEKNFYSAAQQGSLYEYMASLLDMTSRDEVKQYTFEILFGTPERHENIYPRLKKYIPNILELIKTFKKDCGYNISILLQNIEASIFVDYFQPFLIYLGIPCVTVHDCLLVKKSDMEKAVHAIRVLSSRIELKATFSANGYIFNTMESTCMVVSQETQETFEIPETSLRKLYAKYTSSLHQ
jgi:hypothetical protein